jgi:pimeloyl-ACP methyl ester carboxylesterase
MRDVIDESERYLDERGLDRPRLAGHSMGGFIALELARRGRAASVCAFSPGGLWSDDLRVQVAKRLRRQFALGRLMRPLTPLLLKSPGMRRRALTDATLHGDRLSYQRASEITEVSLHLHRHWRHLQQRRRTSPFLPAVLAHLDKWVPPAGFECADALTSKPTLDLQIHCAPTGYAAPPFAYFAQSAQVSVNVRFQDMLDSCASTHT